MTSSTTVPAPTVTVTFTDPFKVRHTFTRTSTTIVYKREIEIVTGSSYQGDEYGWREHFQKTFTDVASLKRFISENTFDLAAFLHPLEPRAP